MTLEQLRIFVAVAERQHVTQAARALNLAQSATSHAIAALETRHDTKLFNRVGRGIELTEAGHVFLASAKSILARVEAAELTLNEFGSLKRGTLAVQASQTIASYWLPRHLVAFRQAYPKIEIRLAIGNTAQVAAAVENGTAELGFVEGVVENEHFASTPVARDQLVMVVGPDHPWGGRDRLTPGDLTDGDWVLREPGSGNSIGFRGRPVAARHRDWLAAHSTRVAIQRGGSRGRGGWPGCDRDFRLCRRAEPRSGPLAAGGLPSSGARIPRSAAPGALSQPRRNRAAEYYSAIVFRQRP